MSLSITPSFTITAPTASVSDARNSVHSQDAVRVISTVEKVPITYASSSHDIYQATLPTHINVISKAVEKISSLPNASVKEQTIALLSELNSSLLAIAGDDGISNRLPSITLIDRDDQSVLLEWNFENFRIGFAIEVKKEDSNYYLISDDPVAGSFETAVHRMGNDYVDVIRSITDYVVRNT